MLKPLDRALRDGDTIRAIVRNTASNQDGKTPGITFPSRAAQESLIRSAYDKAGLNPLDTDYVEAHGTGTQAGDPIEARAIATVFGSCRPPSSPVKMGSIKSNIGHLEGASGIAGLIKAVLMLQNQVILPSRNFQKANSKIPMQEWNIQVSVLGYSLYLPKHWLIIKLTSLPELTPIGSDEAISLGYRWSASGFR